jgi:pheromone shutdown protein TraB
VARSLAEARGVRHGDIRAVGAEKMTVGARDEAMAHMIVERFGDARSVLVIVGEDHRAEVARILNEKGWTTESTRFPEQ